MLNKILSPIIIAFLGQYPALQLGLLISVSFFTISVITMVMPYNYKDLNIMAIYLNFTDVVVCVLLAFFINHGKKDSG